MNKLGASLDKQPASLVRYAGILVWCTFFAIPVIAAAQSKDVVVVGGAITEIVYALGAEKRIAATDTTSNFPVAAQSTVKIGYARALSAEGLLALKPKLVLATGEAGPPAAIAQIKSVGVDVQVMAVDYSIDGLIARIERVAQALMLREAGSRLVGQMRADWAETERKVYHQTTKPKVIFLLAHAGPAMQVAGEDTAADTMIRLAGGVNAISGFKGYRPLTAEAVVAAAPEVILISSEGLATQGGNTEIWKKPGLALTPAGASKRIVVMDAMQLLGFGPRLPQAVARLADDLRKSGP
jgi:iron complex transport system substrate-binding protein